MNKAIIVPILLAFLLAGCVGPDGSDGNGSGNGGGNTAPVQDGKSIATAIVMPQINEEEGIAAEYGWLTGNACVGNGGPNEILEQNLLEEGKSFFDVLTIECQNGEEEVYYFNIDNFFGKWE